MKLLFRIALVLLLLVVLVLGLMLYKIDSVAAAAIEEGGTIAMGVETHVGSTNIGIIRSPGRVAIEGLHVDNPAGYADKDFFSLENAVFHVEASTASAQTLVIPEIVIEGFTLAIERNENGTNYGKILDHLKRFESGDAEPTTRPEGSEESTPEGPQKKFVIRKVKLNDVKANVKLEALGQKEAFTVAVPNFQIENVGTSDDSKSVSELLSTVLHAALDEVAKNGGGLLPADMVADIKSQLSDVQDAANAITEDLQSELKKALDKDTSLEDKKESAKEALDKTKKGLKDLLKKDN